MPFYSQALFSGTVLPGAAAVCSLLRQSFAAAGCSSLLICGRLLNLRFSFQGYVGITMPAGIRIWFLHGERIVINGIID